MVNYKGIMVTKRKEFDKWVQVYLSNPRDKRDLIIDTVPWQCPQCGKKWTVKLTSNNYLATHKFVCKKCKASQMNDHVHIFMN